MEPPEQLTIQDFREYINKGIFSNPLVFLECIAQGNDPRSLSRVYQLVKEIEDFEGDEICQPSWDELRNIIKTQFMFEGVGIGDSITAAKTLAEYLYPKRKQIDMGTVSDNTDGSSNGLTEEEIILFKEKFNDDF